MSARLLQFEQWVATLAVMRGVIPRWGKEIDALDEKLKLEIDNLEYCFMRDRINHQKPE